VAFPLTRELGKFVAGVRFDTLPPAAVKIAKLGFTDCVAVMIAGSGEPVVAIARDVLVAKGANQGEARLIPSGDQVSALDAALVNGAAGHAFDYDDVALDGHPSAVLVPAILAEAEALGASGRDMIGAYVAGYEVWAELLSRRGDMTYDAQLTARSIAAITERWRARPRNIVVPGHDLPMLWDAGRCRHLGRREAAITAWLGDDLEQTTAIELAVG